MTTPLRVSDIAQLDTSSQFVNDVKLSTFYEDVALNRDLMERFIFTRGTGGHNERKGTADLLGLLRQNVTAIGQKNDNRFVFMATYGHGKSHLGLALANYFGAQRGSPELETVLQKLSFVVSSEQAQVFRDFRDNDAGPFLVLILRGDLPGSLRDNFFKALDVALEQRTETRGIRPPFWFGQAETLLERLSQNPEHAAIANAYLAPQSRDLQSLQQEVSERHSGAYQQTVGAFRAVHGIEPNLGGEASLSDAVKWVVSDLCAPGKPFGGLLILFDEFSRFVQDYGQNNPYGAPLQDMLSGVSDLALQGKVLFVGLSQHDPSGIAERYGGGEELIKELNRIPGSNRHTMQTRLEDVLGGVIKTDDSSWRLMLDAPGVAMSVSEASDTARQLFADRYGPKQLGWDLVRLTEMVAKNCFPLHPLTTAFLSSVTLNSTATVRSVLGFLQDEGGYVKPRFSEAALTSSGQPNWVLPTRLVDYFGEALNDAKYKTFKNVIKPDLSSEQQEVLKAMLLLDVAELPTKQVAGGYTAVIANLTGQEEGETGRTLKMLLDQHYVRYDALNKTYSFNVGSSGAQELDRLLESELEVRESDKKLAQLFDQFSSGTNPVNNLKLGQKYSVAVEWGHPDDWAAEELLVPVSALKQDLLHVLHLKYAVTIDSAPEARGVVVIVVPRNQKEADEASGKINGLLQYSQKDQAAPLLFLVPHEGHAELYTNLLKLALLNELSFKGKAQPKVGESAINELRESLNIKVSGSLTSLRAASDLVAPPAIQQALKARQKLGSANRVGEALGVIYDLAYPDHPDSFFKQYKQNAINLSRACVDVVYELLENNLDAVKWSANASVPQAVVNLLQKDWKIVSTQKQIIEPEFTKLKKAWDRFEGTFSPKVKSIYAREVLLELLQPPYGYDHNTLALLFAAWLGRNRDAISISSVVKLSRPTPESKEVAFRNSGGFLKAASAASIHRKDIAVERAKILDILTQLKEKELTLSSVDAQKGIVTLEEFKRNNPSHDAEFLKQIDQTCAKLKTGLINQEAYDKAVENFENKLGKARHVTDIRSLSNDLKSMPALTVVQSVKSDIEQLRQRLDSFAATLTTAEIKTNTQLRDISQYSLLEVNLKTLVTALDQLGYPQLKAQAEEGLKTLAQARATLEAAKEEAVAVGMVNTISVKGNLGQLRDGLAALRNINPKSEKASQLYSIKEKHLKTAIAEYEARLLFWETALQAVQQTGEANKLVKELTVATNHYDGTHEAEQHVQLLERAEALSDYLQRVSNAPTIQTPEDVQRWSETLEALRQTFQNNVTAEQLAQIDVALRRLDGETQIRETQATNWLQEKQQRFQGGDIRGLDKVLASPPPFLNDMGYAALGELRMLVNSQLDVAMQEGQQLKFIQALPHSGSLTTLQQNLQQLASMTLLPGNASDAGAKKRQSIEAELARLQQLPQIWEARMAEVGDLRNVELLSKEVTRQETIFMDSPYEDEVKATSHRLGELTRVFRRCEELQKNVSNRFSDLKDRQAGQEELLTSPYISPKQRSILEGDLAQTRQLFDAEIARLDGELDGSNARLDKALSVNDLDRIDIQRLPRSGLPDSLSQKRQELETRKMDLHRMLSQVESLAKASWRTEAEAQTLVAQYAALLTSATWSSAQRQNLEGQRNGLLERYEGKRQEALTWLTQLEESLPSLDGKGLAVLERDLSISPSFLPESSQVRLAALRQAIYARLEEDQAMQIEMLFEKIGSAQRRAALVERLQQLLLIETP